MNWGPEAQNPPPDWAMSAALSSVPRGDDQLTEVTNLRGAVQAWIRLGAEAQSVAELTLEHPVIIDGAQLDRFVGEGIAVLAERLTT